MNTDESRGLRKLQLSRWHGQAASQGFSTLHPVLTLVGSSLSWSGHRGGRKTERHYPGEPPPRPRTSKKGSSCSIWLVAESVASFLHGPQGAGPEGSSEGSSSGPEWPHLHGRHRTAGRPHSTSPTKTLGILRANGLKARCVQAPSPTRLRQYSRSWLWPVRVLSGQFQGPE